ncbi:MAG: ABC transporter ATP-binding protein [Limnochordia bacterium]
MSEPAILAENLIKRYGDLVAVNGITFDVPPNQCFGILGPNGAGKTTTIRMIHCRFAPDGGRLLVLGMDVTKHAREIKARIGLVPQENNLYEDLTLLENVELYGQFFGIRPAVARGRAKELIEFMELGSKMYEPVGALSGGMQRRAVIARALINQPELVVLDEPTTGLDPRRASSCGTGCAI